MTVFFLGTGPSRPIGAPGRSARRQTSTLFAEGGFRLLCDAGPSILNQLRRFRVPRVDAVALTHAHADAAGGLRALDRFVTAPVPVFVGPGVRERLRPDRFQNLIVTTVSLGEPFLTCPFVVKAFPVLHASDPQRFPTVGFHFRVGPHRVTYASDVKGVPPASRRYIRGNNLLIVDGAGWTKDLPNHRGVLNHVTDYLQAGNRRILFTHIGRPVPRHEAANRLLHRVTPRAALAYDGLRLVVPA